ncbi:MAG: hypothetical protein ACLTWO_01060 [Blautia massiliensis (ex Durand et al. 2017)]
MERNTLLLRDTEAFMRGELDNVTVAEGCVVLDPVRGSYMPYGCYTSAPIPMPLFDEMWVSWNAVSPPGTAVEAQARVLVDGNWSGWVSFGKWSPHLRREGSPPRERGPLRMGADALRLESKCATQAQLRIYLYTKDEKVTPAVRLLGVTVRRVDTIPARGRRVNRQLHLMPYVVARRAPALRPWMDLAIGLASLTNRWGADLLPEEFAQVLRDWREPDGADTRNLAFAAAAAGCWGFPTWICWCGLATLRDEMREGYGALVALDSTPAQTAAGWPERRFVTVRGFRMTEGADKVLLCDPWAGENDFDAETEMDLDDFLVAWDNVALLMRRVVPGMPGGPERDSVRLRPAGPEMPGVFHLYRGGAQRPLEGDFCADGGVLAWSVPDGCPHATTGHRTFHFVEPEEGGLRIAPREPGEKIRKYTVYAVDTAGDMLVGEVTV